MTMRAASLNPLASILRRARAWWQARLPLTDTFRLTQRNVYILPSRAGLMLGATLAVLLVPSINYQLNLGYLLTFLLAGSAIVGMYVCHGTLRGITLNLMAPGECFMGASALLSVNLVSTRRSVRHGIGLSVLGEHQWAWTDVPAQGSATVQVAFRPARRGLHPVPTLTAETRFPLGTFRVWAVWRPAAQLLVYPEPEAFAPPLPAGEPRSGGLAALQAQGGTEFDGVRAYRRSDSLKLVIWKKAAQALARGCDELISRDTEQAQRYELWLDLAQAGPRGAEQRLSRLCAWVLAADRRGVDYGLRLPGVQIKPDSGAVHRKRCLEALALC
jgi:uncharacterized protein (DUF58 family)